jgi:uncharacterized DUF497 family protein
LIWNWDSDKDTINDEKHGIDFQTAILVFEDPYTITEEDPYPYEQRWRTTGMVRETVLTVIHTWVDTPSETGRIISARTATQREIRTYEEGYA